MQIISPFTIVEYICLLFALFFLLRDKIRFWKISLFYIALVCLTESYANIISKVYHQHNAWLYNIFMLFEAVFVSYGLYYFLKDYVKIKIWIFLALGLIICVYIFSIFSYGATTYSSVTVSFMSIIFVVFGLLYYYLLLRDDKYVNLRYHPAFWWMGGVVVFYFGGTLANFFDPIFQNVYFGKYPIRFYIYLLLSVFLYSFWSYSFICRARQRKIST